MHLGPLQQNVQGDLQSLHLRNKWPSVLNVIQGTEPSLIGLPLRTTVKGSIHMMGCTSTGAIIDQDLLVVTGVMICVTEAVLLRTGKWRVLSLEEVHLMTMLICT
jgi:hypothetical protein